MSLQQLVIMAVATGVLLMFAWVALWAVVVPSIFFGWTWAGHDAWFGAVFFAGLIGVLLGVVLTRR